MHAPAPSGEVLDIAGDEEGRVGGYGTFEELIESGVPAEGERLGGLREGHMYIEEEYGRLKRLKV